MGKLTMNHLYKENPARAADYARRLREVKVKFDTVGFGARAEASRSLGVSPSIITTVLNEHRTAIATLIVLEEWLAENYDRMIEERYKGDAQLVADARELAESMADRKNHTVE